jgi:hypothetical protein
MQDVSDKLLGQFASCLETKLGESGSAESAESPPSTESTETADDLGIAGAAGSQNGDKLGGAAADSSTGQAAADSSVALDLGSTMLPLVLKRYAPRIIGAIVVLWLVRKILSRR